MEEPIIITRTRYGRVVKKPVLYVPQEEVCDDYGSDDYDSDLSDSDCESVVTNESEAGDDSDLGSFIVDDDDDDDDDEVSNELKNMDLDS